VVDEPNGQLYQSLYHVSEFPHVAIIHPRTGARKKVWSNIPDAKTFVKQGKHLLFMLKLLLTIYI
jgi:hypothetical protein